MKNQSSYYCCSVVMFGNWKISENTFFNHEFTFSKLFSQHNRYQCELNSLFQRFLKFDFVQESTLHNNAPHSLPVLTCGSSGAGFSDPRLITGDVCSSIRDETAISVLKEDVKMVRIVMKYKHVTVNMHKAIIPKCSTFLLQVQVGLQQIGLNCQFQVLYFATRCELQRSGVQQGQRCFQQKKLQERRQRICASYHKQVKKKFTPYLQYSAKIQQFNTEITLNDQRLK